MEGGDGAHASGSLGRVRRSALVGASRRGFPAEEGFLLQNTGRPGGDRFGVEIKERGRVTG